ncbi:phosphomannomutase/phosphoglucomutase [Mangrovimicrobium sediminis]|uniref:phosphomannomutase n=1 Tax=Mangrovimicrobium sediminis TaxID=2562682 RepID=A0A4Z0LZX7_9GAMM|nr:phosphomannomutase/phosphoglucomutase [Haliea sp. SAOS-164]TGD72746.1 phosphomannomutase/phosphoglucomutase [Haliea sp. SAOS-164]
MFKKFTKKKKATENPAAPGRGIVAGANAIYQVTGIGLAIAVLILVGTFVFLALVREPAVRAAQMENIAGNYAEQQAGTVNAYVALLRQRLAGSAGSATAGSVLQGQDREAIAAVERELIAAFPDLVSLRVVPVGEMGTAEFDSGEHGLRNHIEVDMVRRAAEGNPTQPESFRHEDRWLTSLAELVRGETEALNAVIVASVDNATFATLLESVNPGSGHYALEQRFTNRDGSTHTNTIAEAGSGNVSSYESFAVIPDTNWRIAFTPSKTLMATLAVSNRPLYVVLGMCLAAVIGGFVIVAVRIPKIIEHDTFRILAAADRKTDLTLAVPQLVDVARQLRRATLRALRQAAEPDRAIAVESEGEILDFEDNDLGADFDEVLDLDTEIDEEEAATVAIPTGFPAHIFRAYDIRGNAADELTSELMAQIGQALGSIAGERDEQTLLVGCDGRTSSPALKSALVRSLLETGRDVIDIGLVPTPILYFATQHLNAHSGLMITGSHNPRTDNGLKIVLGQQTIHAGGIQQVRDRVLRGGFSQGKGRLINEDVVATYVDQIQQDIAIAVPLKIVIDAGNGATSELAPLLFEELGCEVIPMFCTLDGNFPNHPPDTSDEANLTALVQRVQDEGADFGVAFDGDGDRLAVVTPSGRIVRSDVLLMIFAQDVVSRNPGADVVFDVKCSRNLTDLITQCGGRPVLCRTGHAFMKQKMAETGALLGGEFSGHMFFGERWFGFDDGMYAAARLAEILSTQGDDLDTIIEAFPTSVNTPEIRIPVEESEKQPLIERITRNADFSSGKVNTMDGIRVDFAEGWGLLRASNTTPALTARFEAESEEALDAIMHEFRQQIALVDPSLKLNF